ncbi:hypothetical protein BU204_05595 [Actinophytocola xanthii]|uniref:Uncharacterized protein n=2 Tax=Actinophytocola xanthii TaxID=1912961 RepID=A0A1Q8CW46_9PSEU|nr:hypothetical protein BU204_05595 [Actinophytocola xanthii]
MVRGSGAPAVVLGSGETLLVGRAPQVPEGRPETQLRFSPYPLPDCAEHVSRLLGEVVVGDETVRLRWRGNPAAQLSSMFDAPGGARRVILTEGVSAQLDDGENQLLVLRGKQVGAGHADLLLAMDVTRVDETTTRPIPLPALLDRDAAPTKDAPGLVPHGREWFVALALAEPWLSGADDYPRPPTNREIYERVLSWRGYAWNLERPQRVDEAIRKVSAVAFGPHEDPFRAGTDRQVRNVRFAVGRRAAEVRLVTADDLSAANRARRNPSTEER